MKIELLHNTPLEIADKAISKCWDKCSDEINLQRIYRVGHKNKHESTLEHIVYSFDIDGISRTLLQELARHRIASLSVKSTRYTLKELKDEKSFTEKNVYGEKKAISVHNRQRARKYIVFTGYEDVNTASIWALEELRKILSLGISNDSAKYCLPESYKTSLVWTINMRSLRNFIALRSNKSALWEIRLLANEIYKALPTTHQFMFVQKLDEQYHGEWERDLIEGLQEW